MNEISPQQLLNQIRSLSQELQVPTGTETTTTSNFGEMLETTLHAVNEAQQTATELKVGFEAGSTDASLAEVMISVQKADLSFRAVTEVRNKLVTAYQEIMNMPV